MVSLKSSNKNEAIDIVNKKLKLNIANKNTIFSNINKTVDVWWFEISNTKFNNDLYILLNNAKTKSMYCFLVPKGAITNPQNVFYQRKDKTNKSHIEVLVDNKVFMDRKGGFLFTQYLIKEINY
ncbi:MAG: hypothetical protein Ta2B_16320 [Termitinemataceae bacterium]|nr:MAG: hypothetical protein Ta2B_16320 [Termitinemataceae bacterium]